MSRPVPGLTNRPFSAPWASAVLFAAWTVAALTPVSMQIDHAITITLQRVASPGLDVACSIITILGNIEVTVPAVLLLSVVLIRAKQARLAIVIGALLVGGVALEWVAKHYVPHASVPLDLQRQGINLWHPIIRTPFGYPSGHAFRTLFLTWTTGSAWQPPDGGARRRLRAALVVVVGLIGLALVYQGAHWTSEVIGGYLLAALCIQVTRLAGR